MVKCFLFTSFYQSIVSIWFHELGHQLYFKIKLKKNVKVKFINRGLKSYWECGNKEDYDLLSKVQYRNLMLWGTLIGLLPILASGYIWFPYLGLVLPYATGVWSDIKEIYKTNPIPDKDLENE